LPKDLLGFALANLAGVHIERGELADAFLRAREGLALCREAQCASSLDHLALGAGLLGKFADAARLAGYTDHWWTAKEAKRQPNEARARGRVDALLRENLTAEELDHLLVEGAKLSIDEACRLALQEGADEPARHTRRR
jgi:hypothetical protein